MTQSQKAIIKSIDNFDSYSFYKQLDNGDIKLLSTTSLKTLTLSVDDLKYLLDNELIEIEGLNITTDGCVEVTPGIKHKANHSKIEQFKQDIQNVTNEQREQQIRQREEQLKQIQEQHKAEERAELQRKVLERTDIVKTVMGLLNDFKRPNQHKQFKTQNNNVENLEISTEVIKPDNNIQLQPTHRVNRASQYAQSLNNPNLDFNL